ncbi:hypothetical protein KUCAC02_037370 [Chaenocephalus aceratus]|nr:hypothetical protein KUCAC02_037370 [Chaenocephalus aceratus]
MPAFCSNFLQRQTQTNSIGQLKAEWGRDVRGGGIQEDSNERKQLAFGSLYFEASLGLLTPRGRPGELQSGGNGSPPERLDFRPSLKGSRLTLTLHIKMFPAEEYVKKNMDLSII